MRTVYDVPPNLSGVFIFPQISQISAGKFFVISASEPWAMFYYKANKGSNKNQNGLRYFF